MLKRNDFASRSFSVLGAAKSGIAAANVLARLGADVLLSDKKSEHEMASLAGQLDARVKLTFGKNEVRPGDIVVISPGIAPHTSAFAEASELGSAVWSEVELFYRLCPAPIVAITGTDGKSTTTELIAHLLRVANPDVRVGGNIGNPLCGELETISSTTLVVAEISCFQLVTIAEFRPYVAVFTNIADDHAYYHGSHEAYQEAKRRLYENMGAGDFLVLNADDAAIASWPIDVPARQIHFSRRRAVEGGLYFKNDRFVSDVEGSSTVIATRSDLPLPGDHNVENALAALAVTRVFGMEVDRVRAQLRTFRGLPHRIESVGTVDGVLYVNDSKATNPHSVIAALQSVEGSLILLAGGADKNTDFGELADELVGRARLAVLFGETKEKLRQAIAGRVPTQLVHDLREAVQLAHSQATSGETVLLSPACSSFDQFRSFEHRGDCFVEYVRELGALGS